MINYKELLNEQHSVRIKLNKYIKVNKEDWLGYGLFWDEEDLFCELSIHYFGKHSAVTNIVCGGKHFWRKLKEETTKEEAEAQFLKNYQEYWIEIPEFVTPEWFSERGFEWV